MNKVRERILKEISEAKYQDYEKHRDLISFCVCDDYFGYNADTNEEEESDFDEVIVVVEKDWLFDLIKRTEDFRTISDLRKKYMNKEFVIITNTERTVLVTDIDELYMTVKVTKNRYSRQNCVGNYFPYVDDIVKYPLTALPVMFKVSEP